MQQDFLSASYSEKTVGTGHHYHDGHQLLYIVEGEVALLVNGKKLRAGNGSLLLFNRFEEHSITVLSTVYKRYSVRISSDFGGTVGNALLFSALVNRSPKSGNVLYPLQKEAIATLFQSICREYAAEDPMREQMLASLVSQLLITVCRMLPPVEYDETDGSLALVYRLQSDLEKTYGKRITLSQLAKEYHVSVSHLSHLFKKVTGSAVMEYLFACRMLAAKRLLATTDLSVGEIVDACGFCDNSNFSRSFRQRTGFSPTAFRKQYQKEV